MKKKSLGDRMKEYERVSQFHLIRRMPIIIRLDGVAFHTFTKGIKKPYDPDMMDTMHLTMLALCKEIHGCKIGYTQSDEISLLLTDYASLNTEPWFGNDLQKIVSVSAAKCTKWFNYYLKQTFSTPSKKMVMGAEFDSRAWSLSKEEVNNYFLWRQQDATRNAIQSAGHANFSNKELHKLNCGQVQEKLFQERGINFNNYPSSFKRGACTIKNEEGKWQINHVIPLFNKEPDYINRLL